MARKLIPMAISYDFDGTLAPGNMQEYDFIPALHTKPSDFWKMAGHLDQQTQQIDAQLATQDEQTQVLKELRKAIIHEAVTGKIDLSGAALGKEKR